MRMKAPKYHVSGLLEELWQFTAKNAPLGDVGKFDNADIAAMVEWEGDPDELVDMLIDCGWLDESKEWRLVVHDWHDHAPNYVKGNVQRHHNNEWASLPKEIKVPPILPRGEQNNSAETSLGEILDIGYEPPKEPLEPPYEPPKEGANPTEKAPTLPSQAKPSLTKPKEESATPRRSTRRKSVKAEDVALPDGMDTDEVRVALGKWLDHKRTRRATYFELEPVVELVTGYARDYQDRAAHVFIVAVSHSIANNYQGCFPPNDEKRTSAGFGSSGTNGRGNRQGTESRPGTL